MKYQTICDVLINQWPAATIIDSAEWFVLIDFRSVSSAVKARIPMAWLFYPVVCVVKVLISCKLARAIAISFDSCTSLRKTTMGSDPLL